MIVVGMPQSHIENNPDTEFMSCIHQVDEILPGAIGQVELKMIFGHITTII